MLYLLTLFLYFSATIDRTHFPRASVRAGAFVHLRIEGLDSTIHEGPLFTKSHNVSTPSGGTHECDGLNNNSNPKAGPAASTTTLDDAARLAGFLLDGTFSSELRLLHHERRPRPRNFDTVLGTITRISAHACRGLLAGDVLWEPCIVGT